MNNTSNIWTPSNIILFSASCIILVGLIVFLISRFNKKQNQKKMLINIAQDSSRLISEHKRKNNITSNKWDELSCQCIFVLEEYCRDKKEVQWIMENKAWPIIDILAYQDQEKAIDDFKIFGTIKNIGSFLFDKEQWHYDYIESKSNTKQNS